MPHSLKTIGSLLLFSFLGSCNKQSPTITGIEFQDPAKGLKIESITHLGNSWQVVTMDPVKSRPKIRLSDSEGKPLRDFSAFAQSAQKAGQTTIWMMNAGMYHKGGAPVGLCIIDRQEITPINTSIGKGNFFLKPNGIFFLTENGAQVIDTTEWNPELPPTVQCATQSGPLLVRQGKLHPAIQSNSPNKFIRNGVGVRTDGHLCFVISTNPVTFHAMALFFRDYLKCPDALYLDGAVSALHSPKAGITSQAKGLGPVIGLWE